MSTILKALRRLEEEKARGVTSRPLREDVASGPVERPRRRLPWLPLAAMLIGAGLGASAWWVWPYERGGAPVRDVAAEAPAAAVSPVTAPPAPLAVAAAPVVVAEPTAPPPEPAFSDAPAGLEPELETLEPGGPPEDAFASAVAVVERPKPTPRIEPVPEKPVAKPERVIADPPRLAAEPTAVTAKRTPPKPVAAQPSAPLAPPAAKPAPVAEPAPPVAKTAPAAPATRQEPPEPAPARVATTSAPAAAASEADAAAVRVKRTQWHPDATRRSADVELAGKSENVREGDVVGEYVVTEIRPSGVVLTRDGRTIERGIGK